MSDGLILKLMSESLYQVLFLSVPLLGISMIVGLIISIFQATTSIQEQTLTFVPKMVVILLLMVFLGPLFLREFKDFTYRIFEYMAQARL
ncbi:MAG: flagellar biosynthesis protein FliQ [Brevinematales bacterium]